MNLINGAFYEIRIEVHRRNLSSTSAGFNLFKNNFLNLESKLIGLYEVTSSPNFLGLKTIIICATFQQGGKKKNCLITNPFMRLKLVVLFLELIFFVSYLSLLQFRLKIMGNTI